MDAAASAEGVDVNNVSVETDAVTGFITVKHHDTGKIVVIDSASGNMAWTDPETNEIVAVDAARDLTATTDALTGEVKATDSETGITTVLDTDAIEEANAAEPVASVQADVITAGSSALAWPPGPVVETVIAPIEPVSLVPTGGAESLGDNYGIGGGNIDNGNISGP